jgi:hypothetical protein
MPHQDDFYMPPGQQFEPGDIFLSVPFLSLKYPLAYWRMRQNEPQTASLFDSEHAEPRASTDTPRSSVELRAVILVSHGCEVDRVLRKENLQRNYWLAAPIHPIKDCGEKTINRIRNRTQPNRFYLPPSPYTDDKELCVDLRKITPINCQYFVDSNRLCSLTEQAQEALFAQLGFFFSGSALYIGPVECPSCGTELDASQFKAESNDEADFE